MVTLTEPFVDGNTPTIRAIATAHHPIQGRKDFDVVVKNDAKPIAGRIRNLIQNKEGAGWTVTDWHPTGDEF